ncbi:MULTISPECIES: sugar kinase [Sorangium]|uniref:Sugar kinase n=1 Tax=Sorangium cellulosum TaxID=56 RepID=A0A4P2QPZ3_SORCE|nr:MULTISPECIES: sugar kinase [Sorangium]AUX32205.1 sugar kinase [Sorangium cellulosum]WCQ91576.1 5-dehydro-2-deoxygluconokinase [Sorangium sp. Soce836]
MQIRNAKGCAWDQVSLGEVMLRLDPGERRVHTTRTFDVGEGGGEYNVARGLRRCFGLRTAIVTSLADNAVGRLIEDLMLQGGVDTSLLRWVDYDGVGREVRNGLNFTERGFGPRAAAGCSDRGHSAASRLKPGDLPWKTIFGERGARWFHTGGIFCALSEAAGGVAREAMEVAREHDVRISYDLNYRPSLWKNFGGQQRAREVNRALMPYVDCVFGNEEDFVAGLGFEISGVDTSYSQLDTSGFRRMISEVVAAYPNISVVATSLRTAKTASVNGWGGILYYKGEFYEVPQRDIEILDRVGGGDSFASGIIYGLLADQGPQWALECGVAHGALAMSTPGDTSMASLAEVRRAMGGGGARIER